MSSMQYLSSNQGCTGGDPCTAFIPSFFQEMDASVTDTQTRVVISKDEIQEHPLWVANLAAKRSEEKHVQS